jgi:hypothetical protein
MALFSSILRNDPRLQACQTKDASHLTEGTTGPHVKRVQTALFVLDGLKVDREEERSQRYGKSTASAVLQFKTKRHIINHKYQSRPDNIVGKMTIAALDAELWRKEAQRELTTDSCLCGNDPRSAGVGGQAGLSAASSFATASFALAPTAGNAAGPSPAATAKLIGCHDPLSPASAPPDQPWLDGKVRCAMAQLWNACVPEFQPPDGRGGEDARRLSVGCR